MALDVQGIRGWLLCQPRATTLRVLTAEDQNHEVAVTNGASWMAIAQSIQALDPIRIEAYDAEGKIIRVVRPREENVAPRAADAAPAPLMLPPGTDPQSMLLLHFADLLANAYRHSTDVAFERLASLFEAVNRRSEALERSLDTTHRLLQKAAQAQLENAPEQPPTRDLLEEMVAGFMQGKTQGADEHGPNGSNGKVG